MVSPRGNLKGANPANFTTTYVYDFNSNRVRVTHPYPGGGFVHRDTRFDELNRAVTSIDPFGKQTQTGYDNNGNVVSTVDPLGQKTTVDYDVNGRPKAVTAPAGGGSSTEYDAAGNPVKQTAPDGGATTWTYNDNGDLVSVVDPRGNAAGANPADYTISYTYDAGRNLTSLTDQLGRKTAFTYDANRRVTAATDANGHTTTYRYDDADHLDRIAAADAFGAAQTSGPVDGAPRPVTSYLYDGAGHVVQRTDPNGHVRRFGYDKVGRLSAVTDALGRQTTYGYDAEGDLQRVTTPGDDDPAERSIVNTYDILGRHVGQDLGAGDVIYAWGYDARNRVTSLADPAGLRTQRYDDAGRLTAIGRGEGQTFSYGYDANGNVTSRTWPDGTRVTSRFDAADRMVSLTAQGGAAGPQAATYGFDYDVSGRISRTTYPAANGLVTDRTYDRAGRLSDLNSHDANGVLARYQTERDGNGNPTSITTTRGDRSQTIGYSYDVTDRLTGACVGADCATAKIGYTYDGVGNRLTQKVTAGSGTVSTRYRYNDADQLTKATVVAPNASADIGFAYDESGNQIKAGPDTFRYHLDHTLASAVVGGVNTSYTYDAQGIRLSAVSNLAAGAQSRTSQTDHNARLPRLSLERTETASGGTGRGFLTGPSGTPIGLLTGGRTDSFVPDWLGGVAGVVSPAGGSQASYDYDPFGNARTDGTAGGTPTVDNPIRFAGAYQDSSLGDRYSTIARVYDPSTGRFGGVDPASAPLNTPASSSYAYVGNKPTVYTDPSGAVAEACAGMGGANDHGDAVELTLRQLDVQYSPFNVYGECPAYRRTLHAVSGSVPAPGRTASPAGFYCFTTTVPTSCPDVIVAQPAQTFVYEIKPGTDQLSEIKPGVTGERGLNNAAQVQRYVWALSYAGYPNVAPGPDVVPDARTYEDGSTLTIFAGSDWDQYARPGARKAANTSGIVYYQRTKPPKVPTNPPNNPKKPPNSGQNEEPKEEPTKVPTQGPVSDPGVISSGVTEDLILVGAVVVAVVLVVVFWPEIVAATAIGGLLSWAF